MQSDNQPVIETHGLTKIYKSRRSETLALSDLDLSVQPGEIFGYLGPNGAGKTTTIRILLDLIRPTNGSAKVLGMDIRADSVKLHHHIGFLPGELSLWANLSGLQVIQYVGRVRGDLDMAFVQQLSQRLKLDLSVRVRNYSSGNRRKLGIVVAMMHKPKLLILDEPTNGLDPLIQQTFYHLVHEARDAGQTVFLSSHILSEVQAICDRIGILRNGELKAVERVDELTRAEFRWVKVQFREPVNLTEQIAAVPGVSDVTHQGDTLSLRLSGDFDPLLHAIDGHYVVDMAVNKPSLEEIFLAYYGNSTVEGEVM